MGDSDDAQSDRCENPVNSKGCPAQARTHFVPQLGHMSGTTVPFSERRSGSSGTWELLHAVPVPAGATSTTLAAVSCTASNACTAVGSYLNAASENHTLAERWNGTEWAIQTGATVEGSPTLSGVSCTSATACVAVGLHNHFPSGQTTVAETWNGTKWSVQEVEVDLRSPAGGGPTVSCTSSTACTIVGDFTVSGKQHTGVERWNGTKWSSQEPVNPQENNEFYGVSCSSATECTAVGSATSNTGSQTLVERWNTAPHGLSRLLRAARTNNSTRCLACRACPPLRARRQATPTEKVSRSHLGACHRPMAGTVSNGPARRSSTRQKPSTPPCRASRARRPRYARRSAGTPPARAYSVPTTHWRSGTNR